MNDTMTENQKFQMILDSMGRIENRLDRHIERMQVQLEQIRDGMIFNKVKLGVIYAGLAATVAGSVAWFARLR